MAEDRENSQAFGFQANNYGYNTAGALQIRLNIKDDVVEQFEIYLRGSIIKTIEDAEGNLQTIEIKRGEPIVNEQGYQAIMRWLSSILNGQTVQGNFIQEKDYQYFMRDYRMSVTCDLMANREKYGIDTRQYPSLMDSMMLCSQIILTRAIFNKEREGMNNTTKIQETMHSQQTSKGGLLGSIPIIGGKR